MERKESDSGFKKNFTNVLRVNDSERIKSLDNDKRMFNRYLRNSVLNSCVVQKEQFTL